MQTKYSIILPVYQAGKYIEQCLQSIIKQVTKDTQIILVDDGSEDDSGAICDAYAAQFPQISVYHQQNSGISAARNQGLAMAEGEYIIWVDPDDTVDDHWFESINNAVEQYEPDVIVFDMLHFWDETRQETKCYGRPAGFVDPLLFCQDVARDLVIKGGLPDKVIRKEFYPPSPFDTALTTLEDFAMLLDVLIQAKKVYYIPRPLYCYRQHSQSLLHSMTHETRYACFEIAKRRSIQAPIPLRNPAIIGAIHLGFMFCRDMHDDSRSSYMAKEQKICRRYIRKHLACLFRDKDVSVMWKIKFLLMSMNVYAVIMKAKKLRVGSRHE